MEANPKSQGSACSLEILVEVPEQTEHERLQTEAEEAAVAAAVAEVAAADAERRLHEQAEIVRRERERALLARERATQALKVAALAAGEQPESERTQREGPAPPVHPAVPEGPSARSRGRLVEWGGIAGGALLGLIGTLIMRLMVEGDGPGPPQGPKQPGLAVTAGAVQSAPPAPPVPVARSASPAPPGPVPQAAPLQRRAPAGPPIPPLRTSADQPQHVRRTHRSTVKRHHSRHHHRRPAPDE